MHFREVITKLQTTHLVALWQVSRTWFCSFHGTLCPGASNALPLDLHAWGVALQLKPPIKPGPGRLASPRFGTAPAEEPFPAAVEAGMQDLSSRGSPRWSSVHAGGGGIFPRCGGQVPAKLHLGSVAERRAWRRGPRSHKGRKGCRVEKATLCCSNLTVCCRKCG